MCWMMPSHQVRTYVKLDDWSQDTSICVNDMAILAFFSNLRPGYILCALPKHSPTSGFAVSLQFSSG